MGAGLTGATLAWLAARAGHEVLLAPAGRGACPAMRAGAAVVRGVGLPEPLSGGELPVGSAPIDRIADLARRGESLVLEALMRARRSCRARRVPSRRRYEGPDAGSRAETALLALREIGVEARVETDAHGVVVSREDDLLVATRRLTFELLRLARRAGALWAGRGALEAIAGEDPRPSARIDGRCERFDRIVWTCGRPDERAPFAGVLARRGLLVRTLRAGEKPLDAVLRFDELLLLPCPFDPRRVRTIESGESSPPDRIRSPAFTGALSAYVGAPIRQHLEDQFEAAPAIVADPPGPVLTFAAPPAWPLATLFGRIERCLAAV